MTYSTQLAAMNNTGVRLYEQGRLQEAQSCFQQCIDEMLKLILQLNQQRERSTHRNQQQQVTTDEDQEIWASDEDEMSDDEEIMSDDEDSYRQERRTSTHQQATVLTQQTAAAATSDQQHNSSLIQGWSKPLAYTKRPADGVFIFSRAIFLQDSPALEHSPSSSSASTTEQLFAALCIQKLAIQYNKALTHHQIHNLTVKSTYYSEDSEMAFHMYEQAFQSLKSEMKNTYYCCSMRRMDRDILKLALFTNMGVIFCNDLGRFSDACECFKAGCGVMMGIVDPSCCLRRVLDGDEMYLLSMNIWIVPQTATPAA